MTEQTVWSDQAVEKLKSLAERKFTAREITEQMGAGYTRNMVIGKLNRLKVPLQSGQTGGWRRGSEERVRPPRKRKPRPVHSRLEKIAMAVSATPQETESLNIPFLDLESHHCRFPTNGEGEPFTFCGVQHVAGLPYCAKHCAISYESPEKRKAKAAAAVPRKSYGAQHHQRFSGAFV